MKCTDYHDSTDERSQYLKILNQLSESKTSDNAMMKEFIDTYKRYIDMFHKEAKHGHRGTDNTGSLQNPRNTTGVADKKNYF